MAGAFQKASRTSRLKLPRRYFKRASVPRALKPINKKYVVGINAEMSGDQRTAAVRKNIFHQIFHEIAVGIVNDSRAAHINMTMGNATNTTPPSGSQAPGWRQLKELGQLNDEVAIIVDGSPTRPIKNVKAMGQIVIMTPPDVEEVILATEYAWKFLVSFSSSAKGPYSGDTQKKGKAGAGYRYHSSFEMFINGTRKINSPADLRNPDIGFTRDDIVVIHNYVPYAAKLERYRYPQSPFFQTFKRTRAKFGKTIGVRFAYVESTSTTVRSSSGGQIPNAQPVIMIGSPGIITSGAPPMKKYIRQRPTHPGQRKG